jgi:hypothetical protein
MTAHRLLILYLWIAPHILLGILAFLLIRRGLVKQFPAFFLYTVFEVLQFLILFTMTYSSAFSGHQYAVTWMAGGAISAALRFAIVREVWNNLCTNYPALPSLGSLFFRWATVILVIVALAVVVYTSGTETDTGFFAIGMVDRAVSIVQCGLLLLLVLLSRFLKFSWHSYASGIALGLGIFASVELASSALRAHLGLAVGRDFFNILSMATFHACVLFWLVALLKPRRESISASPIPAHNLEQWSETLQRVLYE